MIQMKVHSVIDVITNSSTEIYSYVDGNAVDATYEMLDAIIKHSGGTQPARDMFTVTAGADPQEMFDRLDDEEWFEEFLDEQVPTRHEPRGERDKEVYYGQVRKARELFANTPALVQLASKTLSDCEGLDTSVHIVAKDGTDEVAKAVEKFLGCFHSEEYCS